MRLDNFDLNLLVAFNVLLEECSVSKAAQKLNLSQPAMSAALRRLRAAFQDEILVQRGKRMFPTQHALALAPEVDAALIRLRNLISTSTIFDPATSKREFKVIASDYITTVLIVPLMNALQEEAPNVRLSLSLPSSSSNERLENGAADLMISPEEFFESDHPRDYLFDEPLVVVGCSSNKYLSAEISLEDFLNFGHVVVSIGGRETFMENALATVAADRRVEVAAQSFIQVPWLVRGTDRLAVMHERLALVCVEPLGLKISKPLFDVPVMKEMMLYHGTRANDQGLSWLRERLIQFAKESPIST